MSQKIDKIQAIGPIDIDQTLLDPKMVAKNLAEKNPANFNNEAAQKSRWLGESWLILSAGLGADIYKHMEIFDKFRNTIIGNQEADKQIHDTMVRELIQLWEKARGRKIVKHDIEEVCEFITEQVPNEAREALHELIAHGVVPLIGTGGYEDAARAIASLIEVEDTIMENLQKANLDFWFGNTQFVFDTYGNLVTFYHKKNIISYKRKQANKLIAEITKELNLGDITKIAVGDGKSDLGLFTSEDGYAGFAFRPTSNDLRVEAVSVSNTWPELVSDVLYFLAKA